MVYETRDAEDETPAGGVSAEVRAFGAALVI